MEKDIRTNAKKVGKAGAFLIVFSFAAVIIVLFFISAFDTDKTVSQKENRTLKSKPEFSIGALADGTYLSEFEQYYQDTFPFRDGFLDINSKISSFFSESAADSGMVLVEKQEKDDFAGQNID